MRRVRLRNWVLAILALVLMVIGSVPGFVAAFLIFEHLSEQPPLFRTRGWSGESG